MSKYQEALNNYSENVDYRDYSTKTVDIVNESYDTLQELVDQTKTPTLEQIKKEWENIGYECFVDDEDCLEFCCQKNCNSIHFNKEYKWYGSDDERLLQIPIEVHQLITKTMKALGW